MQSLTEDQLAVWKHLQWATVRRAGPPGLGTVQPLIPRDIEDLARILDSLIQANQNHHRPRY